jgi:hypothetical protein
MIDIESTHPEYAIRLSEWNSCYDCYVGEGAIKNKTTTYLPKLERHDDTNDGKARYADYLHRATFFGVVSTVVTGRVGQVMRIPLQGNFTPAMEVWKETMMRDKSNLTELTKRILTEVLTTGRVGLLLDRKEDGGDPYVALYRAQDIVNWDSFEDRLVRLVIKENTIVQKERTGKTIQVIEPRYRELRLNEFGLYEVALYTSIKGKYIQTELLEPTNSGQRLDSIPFQFINADTISSETSKPPLLDLAALNISHYRNSADYEQLLHRVGVAATFFSAGITEDEANDPNNLSVGADVRWYSSNPNAKFGILEFSGNSATAMERAMLEKTQMMATIGGQLVQRHRKQVETAETARLRSASENSVLDTIVSTVEIGLNQILELSAIWLNQTGDINLKLNRDYLDDRWSPEELKAVNEAEMLGIISKQTGFQMRKKMEVYPEHWSFEDEAQLISNAGIA